jgi:hypothetical protein
MKWVADSASDRRRFSETRFLAQQFAANFLVAVVLTIAVTALVFHGRNAVPLWGIGNLAIDLIPSTLLPTIGATLAITKAAGTAIREGLVRPGSTRIYGLLPRQNALAGLVIGLCLLAMLGPAFIAATTYVYDGQPIPYADIVIAKLIYALCLCLANTSIIICRAQERSFDHQGDV